jgi:predicted RNase H-like HicB family nuclease
MQLMAILVAEPEGGYTASNPETGTTSQGETIDEALARLREATELYLEATYEALDDALRRANQVFRAGGVAWLIEGDDKTRMDRRAIESTISKRASELAVQPPLGR